MSKYTDWLLQQDKEFIKYIHPVQVPDSFRNDDVKGITLEELEALDNKFINNPEGE